MTSQTKRDAITDQLLTPENCALVVIDYQPTQIRTIGSADPQRIVDNIVRVAQIAVDFSVPVVLSTVNVSNGTNEPTIKELQNVLQGSLAFDRTTINAWEDGEFKQAVEVTGRKKLVMAALWTEVCLVFPALDAMRDGFEAYPIVDAVAGTSLEAHESGLERLYLAGAKPTSVVQFACELQRDWSRLETAPSFGKMLTSIETSMQRV
jgi:nicotinamidase-related amidase